MLCITVPNDFSALQRAFLAAKGHEPWFVWLPDHLNYFSFDTLKAALARSGFEVIDQSALYPMELFLLQDLDYVADPALGPVAHARRVAFEDNMKGAGMTDALDHFYRTLAAGGYGRDVMVVARKVARAGYVAGGFHESHPVKIGVLGDIHGNAPALAAVLKRARSEGVERLVVTGDLVGYYFDAARVLRLIEEWDAVIVRGNHEDMLAAARSDPSVLPGIRKSYGSGIEAALEELTDVELDRLCDLPHPLPLELDSMRALLCHGAPWDNDQYVYPDAAPELLERCALPGYDVVIMGHTHYPLQREIGGVMLLNPGSVGQPRNREPGAQWALLDTAGGVATLRNEPYNPGKVAAQARARHPELPYLAEVLTRT